MIREKKTNGKQLIRQTSLKTHCFKKLFSLFFAILVIIVLLEILNPFTTNAYTNTVTATLSGTPSFDGLTSITVGDNGVKDPPLVEFKAGKQGWSTDRATATWYKNCNVDDSFINGGTNTVGVTVEYFDEGSGIFCLQYDSSSGSAFKET